MTSEKKQCSVTPHPDIENNYPRTSIPYYIDLPAAGLNEETGLIFTISGYGGSPDEEYENKLRSYLADKHNCIVVGVDYFGCEIKRPNNRNYRLAGDFFDQLAAVYKIKIDQTENQSVAGFLPGLIKAFTSAGITKINPRVRLFSNRAEVYQSFGLLPALDYLKVLAEVLTLYPVNKSRLFILGTSYGGYIGLLLGKLAPNTFQFIVDNSGFAQARLEDVYGSNLPGGMWTNAGGCEIAMAEESPWKDSPESFGFFAPHNQEIRSLLIPEHIYPTKTQYYCFHAVEDMMAPTADKKTFKSLRPDTRIYLDLIDESKVDGRLFKDLKHGMRASLRGIFDFAHEDYMLKTDKATAETDFDLQSQYSFPCSDGMEYRLSFEKDNLHLSLIKP